MVKINKIKLNNFRNFKNCEIIFRSNCNIFFGNNGCGKTNLLECISLLGKGRGFRNSNIENLVFKKENNFIIQSEFELNQELYNIKIYSDKKEDKYKKITSINDEVSSEASSFLHKSLSFLFFLPEMERLFVSSPSFRRNFLDKLIFTDNKTYNTLINKYKKNIIERSKLLQSNNYDDTWLATIEKEISILGIEIYKNRSNKLFDLNDQISSINKLNQYPFNIKFGIVDQFFQKDINIDKYLSSLYEFRDIDARLGGSKVGPHKSDFEVIINDDVNASQLSTGQQKTIILMILIAQCNYLINFKNIEPILLFDEICSHLDDINRKIILDLINKFQIQFFFTGTDKSLFSFMSTNAKFYNITDL